MLERLISLVAPHRCLVCSAEGSLLCRWCRAERIEPLPSRCYSCKSVTVDGATCNKCRRTKKIKYLWAVTTYDKTAQELIKRFKFGRAQAAAEPIGTLMADIVPFVSRDTILVPIPSATKRLRTRGFDHTLLLTKQISHQTGLAYETVLGRLGQSRQVGSKREERLSQLENAFYVNRPRSIEGIDIILVDDIVTTGGTLEAAATALRQVGAKSVSAIVFAQKA